MHKHKIGPFIRSFVFFAILFFLATSVATIIGNMISKKALAYGDLWELLLIVSMGLALVVAIVLEWTRRRQQEQIDLSLKNAGNARSKCLRGESLITSR
ncbi:Uncharacterised protein [Weissella viridescens]|uniref:Uncharacterized protein n=1 Tax=Weissella viridescens TaxID=1629 RepID=A0A380P1T1_WEIVI|nr:Uncharacterised protein [Weissella viridescens]